MKKIIFYMSLIFILGTVSIHAESYTLDSFLEKVMQYNNELKLAQEDVAYANLVKKDAIAGALPEITANAGYNRNLSKNYLFVDMGDTQTKFSINKNNEYNFNVTLNQTLFSGAVYNAIRAANEYSQITSYMYKASETEVITMAKKSYYQTLLLEQVYKVSKKSEENALENYTNINNAYKAGLKSEFAKLQAEVRYKEIIPQTTFAERNYKSSLINLKNIAGIDLEEEIVLEGSLANFPDIPKEVSIDSILIERPDFNALLWEEKLRITGVKVEKAGRIPSLKGFFSYNYSAQSDQFKFEDENNSYTVGLNLKIPIFTGGRTSAKIQQAQVELNRVKINKDRAVDNIQLETKNIRLRLIETYSRIESAKSSYQTAQKAFEIAKVTSENGLTTQLELKDARLMLDQSEIYYFSAIYEYLDAYFEWEKATGTVTM